MQSALYNSKPNILPSSLIDWKVAYKPIEALEET